MKKTQQWALLTAVAVLIVMAGGWMFVVSPQRSKASSLNNQAAAAEQTTATLRTQLAQLEAEKKNLPAQQKILAQIATRIPATPAEPVLIDQVQAAAHTAGVDLSSLDPSAPVAVVSPATTSTEPTTETAPVSTLSLYQMPVSMTVSGNYFNVEMFDHELESLPRAMLVSGLSFSPGVASTTTTPGSAAASVSSSDVTVTLTAQVFMSPPATTTTPTTTTPTTVTGTTTTTSTATS